MNDRELSKVLVVEDDPDVRTVIRLALESRGGLDVLCAESGEQALEKGPGFAPDLVLMDVVMPGMDGPATLEAMRRCPVLSGIPVVFLTAESGDGSHERLMGLGVAGVLPKPFDAFSLADSLRELYKDINHSGGDAS